MNIRIILFILITAGLLLPFCVSAGALTGPIVPCGGRGQKDCTLCDIFVMIQNIIDLLLAFILIIAPVFVVAGGVVILTSAGVAERANLGKRIITSAIIGIAIALLSWTILNMLFITLVSQTGGFPWPWNEIDCVGGGVVERTSGGVAEGTSGTASEGTGGEISEGTDGGVSGSSQEPSLEGAGGSLASLQNFFSQSNPKITPEEILHFNPQKNSGWFYIAQTAPKNGIAFWAAAIRSLSTNATDTSAQLLYGITNTNTGEYYSGFLSDGSFSEDPDKVNLSYQRDGKDLIKFWQTETDLSKFKLKVNLPWDGAPYRATKTLTFNRPILYESGDGVIPMAEGVDSLYASLVLDQGFWIDFQKFNIGGLPLQASSRFHEANHRWGSFILDKPVGLLPAGTVGVAWEILDKNNQRQPGGYTNIDLLIPGYGQVTAKGAQIELVEIEEIKYWSSPHKTYLKKWKISYPGVDLLFKTLVSDQENGVMGNYFYEGMVKVFNPQTGKQVGTGMLEQTHNEATD